MNNRVNLGLLIVACIGVAFGLGMLIAVLNSPNSASAGAHIPTPGHAAGGPRMPMMMKMRRGLLPPFLLNQFQPEERSRVMEISQRSGASAGALIEQVDAQRAHVAVLLSADTLDVSELKQAMANLREAEMAVMNVAQDMMIEIAQVLGPDSRTLLAEHLQRAGPGGRRGPPGPQGSPRGPRQPRGPLQ